MEEFKELPIDEFLALADGRRRVGATGEQWVFATMLGEACRRIRLLQAEITNKDKALTYAVRFLDPANCDRDYVKQALKGEIE